MPKSEKHVFICGNQRPEGHPRGCCDPAGQAALQKLFKQKLAERGLKGKVRANQAGCLDQCEHGPNLVVYPEAVWYGGVTPADVDEIIDAHIVGGKPVERLMMKDSCINARSLRAQAEEGLECIADSFAPAGLERLPLFTHGLRRGLYPDAASRLRTPPGAPRSRVNSPSLTPAMVRKRIVPALSSKISPVPSEFTTAVTK